MLTKTSTFLLLLISGLAVGQDIIRTQTTVVLVPALVKDSKGNTMAGLQAEDFVIEDNGAPQEVKLDETPLVEPVSLVIAVQRGGSAVHEFDRMEGLGTMLDPLKGQEGTRIAIVEFDSHVHLVRDFAANDDVLRNELKKIKPGDGGAAIIDAVDYSLKLLAKAPDDALHMLLLVSETRDHGSTAKITDLVSLAASNKNTVVYALAFSPSTSQILDPFRGGSASAGNSADLLAPLIMAGQAMRKNIPKSIAEMTGGEYSVFRTRAGFDSGMTDFDNHLHDRYLLSFQPKEPKPGLHEIRVRLREMKGATVLARSNYWMTQRKQ
jgi:VWFA-related protein